MGWKEAVEIAGASRESVLIVAIGVIALCSTNCPVMPFNWYPRILLMDTGWNPA